jgi:hypothetical protein
VGRASGTCGAIRGSHSRCSAGRAVEFRDDGDLTDIDRLAQRYEGGPYEDRDYHGITVLAEVDRYHTWGDPAAPYA